MIRAALLFAALAAAQPLPDTSLLASTEDPLTRMLAGIERILIRRTADSAAGRKPERKRLRKILGVRDEMAAVDLLAHELTRTPEFTLSSARWNTLPNLTGEGLFFRPAGAVRARVVVIPDADEEPESVAAAQRLAAAGAEVVVPALIDRGSRWSGNPAIRMTNMPHREFLHRMGWPVGCSVLGLEVQKVLAAVKWLRQRGPEPIGVFGAGEGGGVALYAAALDGGLRAAGISGYFGPRELLSSQPIYRNVWSLLSDFGDAELAKLAAPAPVFVDTIEGPKIPGPPRPIGGDRDRAAPGGIIPYTPGQVKAESTRLSGVRIDVSSDALAPFATSLGLRLGAAPLLRLSPSAGRGERQFREMLDYLQAQIEPAEQKRRAAKDLAAVRRLFERDVIGRLRPEGPARARTRKAYEGENWLGYDVELDVLPDLIASGVLLVPKDADARTRRPLVVVQHGLDGSPQRLFAQKEGRDLLVYQNMGERLARLGFYVYMPQNPYTGDFRRLSRLSHPLGLTLFSFIAAQHERTLEWLSSLPGADPKRIGFYGLSYGGATAVRLGPLLESYSAVICAGNFNEWIRKLTTVSEPYSYMFTHEYEILEWDLASIAGHAEMAMMIAPRPFLVERGHRDGVGIDEWVAYEFAKVRRHYTQLGLSDRTGIAWFDGVHQFHGGEAIPFLRKWLRWPEAP